MQESKTNVLSLSNLIDYIITVVQILENLFPCQQHIITWYYFIYLLSFFIKVSLHDVSMVLPIMHVYEASYFISFYSILKQPMQL